MKITVTSVMVDDQSKALAFYTEKLGFVKKLDIPMGPARWLTVVSPEGGDVQLLLEPTGFPPSKVYQKQLFDAGIPLTMFGVNDCHKEYERLKKLGVVFRGAPTKAGPATIAVLEDTCGNLIQIAQVDSLRSFRALAAGQQGGSEHGFSLMFENLAKALG